MPVGPGFLLATSLESLVFVASEPSAVKLSRSGQKRIASSAETGPEAVAFSAEVDRCSEAST